jgi:cell division transport system permease protein
VRAGFVISEVFQNLRRNTFMIISVVLVTFISLVFVGASMIVQFQVSKAKGDWYNKVHVVVYLCPEYEFSFTCPTGEGATDVDLKRVQGIIKSELSKEVKEVAVQTKAEAYEQFLAKYPGGVYKTQTMTEDDMQISLRLKLNNPNDFQMVNDVLSGREGVQAVYDERQLFENIFNVLNKLTFIGIALAVLMLFSAVLLIATTIRLSAASRKQESEIMRLVGASSMFIQLPFLLEGALAATLGAVFACIFIGVVINMFFPHLLYSSAKWIDLVNLSDVSIVFPVLIIIAIVISIISSAITLRKYTKV